MTKKSETVKESMFSIQELRRPRNMAVFALILLILAVVAYSTTSPCCPKAIQPGAVGEIPLPGNSADIALIQQNTSVKVEVYHFHRKQQCASCIQLGELAEKTVNTHFTNELLSGALVFGHINYELPENSVLSDKFEPSGSSLWIGTTINGEFRKEQDTNVWYKLWDEEGFISYLKGIIEKRLAGDLS